MIQLFLNSPRRSRFLVLDAEPSETIYSIKKKIVGKCSMPTSEQWLSTTLGKVLKDSYTLGDYNIRNLDTLLLHRGRACSKENENERNKELKGFLMDPNSGPPLQALSEKLKTKTSPTVASDGYSNKIRSILLNREQRERLVSFLQYMGNMGPLTLTIGQQQFRDLLSDLEYDNDPDSFTDAFFRKAEQSFRSVAWYRAGMSFPGKILLQTTKSNSYTMFHQIAEGTTAIDVALNDPNSYRGGHHIFYSRTRNHVNDRPAGSALLHSDAVLHGITKLTNGIRHSLFLVHENHPLLNDNPATATRRNVTSFLESLRPKIPDCIVCTVRPATHFLAPCGHFCLCHVCVEKIGQACPMCRSDIIFKPRAIFYNLETASARIYHPLAKRIFEAKRPSVVRLATLVQA